MKQIDSSQLPNSNLPLLAIVGETASGKTAAAIAVAKLVNGEVISADSWAVYKGFDIGTAKPSIEERQGVSFHLIDVADPRQGYSAAEFKRQALVAIADIHARGRIPIIAGGTGLYVDAVLYDFSFLPAGEPGLREELNSLSIEQLLHRLNAEAIDTTGIDIRNKRRLIRLIESNGMRPEHRPLRPYVWYGGIRVDPDQLRERIERRVDSMLAAGLEDEVATLAARYGWDAEPMKGIGYREWRDYFTGTQDLAQTKERMIASTAGLAKRQRTWFKRNQDITWFDSPEDIISGAIDAVNKSR